MRHPNIRPPDFWRDGAPLEPWEVEILDANQAMGINGDDGETFDALTQIAIGGDGVIVTASFRASNVRRMALVPAATLDFVTKTITRYQDLEAGTRAEVDDWSYRSTNGFRPHWYQINPTQTRLWVPLSLPVGSTLTAVTMTCRGRTHSSLPASMPKLSIAIADRDDMTPGIASTTTDSSVDVTAFATLHTVTRTGAHVIDEDHLYYARIEGESGTDSLDGFRVFALGTTVTMTTHDVWIS